ncbi:DUF6883 domain-containing protein [Egbenema bharatensis]|uniref:DUF6883 domain-containing protein n=1 Tax=Egbenema bharatensis TaxID=3463334 RepID=UPI003A863301
MTQPVSLVFPIEKATYLFTRETKPMEGGDKQKFWREVMGFESPESIREAILANMTIDLLESNGQDDHGYRFQAVVLITGQTGVSWQVRTGWIVRYGEDVARFVTAVPERSGRQK